MIEQKLRDMLRWVTPHGLLEFARNVRRDYKYSNLYLKFNEPETLAVLGKNKVLKDIHKNERCFILGTGPSINEIDIKKLKNETCIFLSQFYLHQDYQSINPKYHIFSGMTPHLTGNANGDDWIRFFSQIDQRVPTETFLLMNYLDKKFIEKNRFFRNHNVYYFYFKKHFDRIFSEKIDASSVLFGATAIPIMAIQLAIYMGFKEINLLGIDYSWNDKNGYRHFYHFKESAIDHISLNNNDIWNDISKLEHEFRAFLRLWDEFRILKELSKFYKVKILNATKGGMLEIFERVEYEQLFRDVL